MRAVNKLHHQEVDRNRKFEEQLKEKEITATVEPEDSLASNCESLEVSHTL